MSTTNLKLLADTLRGDLIEPEDPAYDEARSVYNAAIDRRPAAIARCRGAADVVAAIAFAREQGLAVAVRGGGHSAAGFATCDDGLVVDLSPMRGIEVDPARRTARAQGGVLWGEFDRETQAFGLATTGGRVSTTGIAGLTLGGGSGWLERAHGLTCDNLLSAQVVTADGRVLTASADEHPDLFWALRGGGGNFGVVTTFEYLLHRVGPTVLGGMLLYPFEEAKEVVAALRDFMVGAPDHLGTALAFLTAPPEPFVPPGLQGRLAVGIVACYAGPVAEAEEVLRPLRSAIAPAVDLIAPMPYVSLQSMLDASFAPGLHNYWTAEHLDHLSDEVIELLAARAARKRSALSQLLVVPWGGAVAGVDATATAFSARDTAWVVHPVGIWDPTDVPEGDASWAREAGAALRGLGSGGAYLNFLGDEGSDRVRAAFGDATYRRLAEVKALYDPDNLFRLNQNVEPAAAQVPA